jgi:hypothetical protein
MHKHSVILLFRLLPGHTRILQFHKKFKKGKTPSVIHQILVISVPGDR